MNKNVALGASGGGGLAFSLFLALVLEMAAVLSLGGGVVLAMLLGYILLNSTEVEQLLEETRRIRRNLLPAKNYLEDRQAIEAIDRLLETFDIAERKSIDGDLDALSVRKLEIEVRNVAILSDAAEKYVVYCQREYKSEKQQEYIKRFPEAVIRFSDSLAQSLDGIVDGASEASVEDIAATLEILEGY